MFKFGLRPQERLVKLYRQTEAVLFKPVILILALIYFPWYFLIKNELLTDYRRFLFLWTILVLMYGVHKYVLWLCNAYIVTDQRLIIVHYKNLFNKQVWETPLKQILNASFSVKGFWPAMFKFGDVEVRVRGLTTEPLFLRNVAHPADVKDFIWKAAEKY